MDDADALVWLDRAERDAKALPAPGSGTGRPCYINHASSFPERECDGLHGPAAAAFIDTETNMVLSAVRDRLTDQLEPAMPENGPTARNVGRAIGYLIAAIIVVTLVAVLAAGAWWLVSTVWGWLL